jgi:anthranilate synthase component 2
MNSNNINMKILVFDNYDSFTYNLVHLVKKIIPEQIQVDVYRNDEIPLDKVAAYDKIILSPGPGVPSEAGALLPLIKEYASKKSILGVCLGHQAIGEAFGGKLVNLKQVYHGVATPVRLLRNDVKRETSNVKKSERDSQKEPSGGLFEGMPESFDVGRYHSWVISEEEFPEELEVTARDENNYIMALQHKSFDVQGVQFHPESVLTPLGEQILRNWLKK